MLVTMFNVFVFLGMFEIKILYKESKLYLDNLRIGT